MPQPTDDDDDVPPRLNAPAAGSRPERTHGPRQPERRTGERRDSSTGRRDDVEWRQRTRMLVLGYLQSLPEDRLLLWIDGLLLGNASDAHLGILVDAVRTDAAVSAEGAPKKGQGRPPVKAIVPALHPISNAWLRTEWRDLALEFKALSQMRRQHHAPKNRTRGGALLSLEIRRSCLASPIGQRVDQVGLFAEFFDERHLTPGEMAAKLLHRELETRYRTSEAYARTKAASYAGDRGPYVQQAAAYLAMRNALPSWQTLYRKLHRRLPPKQPTGASKVD